MPLTYVNTFTIDVLQGDIECVFWCGRGGGGICMYDRTFK